MLLLRMNLLTAVLLATTAYAAERPLPQSTPAPAAPGAVMTRPLAPAEINAIRVMGRNVLAAKKKGNSDAEESADAEQLARMRASLDQLIAVDFIQNSSPITLQGQENAEQTQSRAALAEQRATARVNAHATVDEMRSRGVLMAARAQASLQADTSSDGSAGFPMRKQRAELFERLAQKIDAAMTDDSPEGRNRIRELRRQLDATSSTRVGRNGMSDALPIGTPTLQAMPAGFVPPKKRNDPKGRSDDNAQSNDTQHTGSTAKE